MSFFVVVVVLVFFAGCYALLMGGGTAPVKTWGVMAEIEQSLADLALQYQAMKSQWQRLKYARLGSFICS